MDSGVLSYEFGEVWWSLLPHLADECADATGNARQRGLKALKARLVTYYKENKVDSKLPLRRLSLRSIKCKRDPKLKAKAGQARRLVRFTAALAAEFQGTDGEIGMHRHKAMSTLQELFDLGSGRELTSRDMSNWRLTAAVHMFHHASCGFAVYPKFHYFMHLPEQVERGGVPRTGLQQQQNNSSDRNKTTERTTHPKQPNYQQAN